MKWLFGRLARLRSRKGDDARNQPPRRGPLPKRDSARGVDDFPIIMMTIAALLITLQQAEAYNARRPVAAVGDRIVFKPGIDLAPGSDRVISARVVTGPWTPPARFCRLNMRLLTHHWGAFTVMAVREDGVMLSWAGGATAKAGNDCEPAHKLLVSSRDYAALRESQRNNVRVMPR